MKNKLNNKGFTLIELLAVLVILVAISSISIPSILSSLERTKEKQNNSRYKIIETAASQYVLEHKNEIYKNLGNKDSCYIKISDIDTLTKEEMLDTDKNTLKDNYIIFTKPNNYEYSTKKNNLESCI